jgi:hypothetical protein
LSALPVDDGIPPAREFGSPPPSVRSTLPWPTPGPLGLSSARRRSHA